MTISNRHLAAILVLIGWLEAPARAEAIFSEAPAHTAADCALRIETGLLTHLSQADFALIGRAVFTGIDPDGEPVTGLGLDELLMGDVTALGAEPIVASAIWSELDSGAPPDGRLALWLLDRHESGSLRILGTGIDLEDSTNSGARDLMIALLTAADPGARGRAISRVAATCGERTRRRAAMDLESDARHLAGLDDRALGHLRAAITETTDRSALDVLTRVYAISAAPDAVGVALQVLASERGEAVLESLERMVETETLVLQQVDLEPHLAQHVEPRSRRRAAELLASVPDEWATSRLLELRVDPDPDTGSMALVGLAGRAGDEVLAECRDRVRLALDTRPQRAATTQDWPLERRLEARDLRALRAGRVAGDRLRLMAAGYVLARAGEDDRFWLSRRVDHLVDRNAGRFLTARLQSPWTDFQDAW